jgi:hypothetical protein
MGTLTILSDVPLAAKQCSKVRRSMHPVLQLGMLRAGVDVDHRCLHKRVAELLLDGQEMRSAMEQIRSQRVPQEVRIDSLLQVRSPRGRANRLAQVLLSIGLSAAQTDKEHISRVAAALAMYSASKLAHGAAMCL